MYNPVSTYRIQFNKDYTLDDFRRDIDYFIMLGPGTIYSSPVFEAEPGSMHGYDVTNSGRINPEIGTHEDFVRITGSLRSKGIGWLQDIVPNHMAFSMNNKWLMDVIEKGQASEYALFFDIDFNHPAARGKLMIPFLGKPSAEAIRDKELTVVWYNGSFAFKYFDYHFPLNPSSFSNAVKHSMAVYPEFSASVRKIGPDTSGSEWDNFRLRSSKLYEHASFRDYIDVVLLSVNTDEAFLNELLGMQHYQLAFWRDSGNIINYRRFFTVNSLICLRMEDDRVFDEYHRFISAEVDSGRISGIRIDHVDGLKAPVRYVEKLRLMAGSETYIVAEKILGSHELLPFDMPLQGTSGYDFLGIVNNLLTRSDNYPVLEKFYRKITGIRDDVKDIIYNKKKFILTKSMNGELENLGRLLDESSLIIFDEDVTKEKMKEAIGEFLVLFPVYRIYSDDFPLTEEESRMIRSVFARAVEKKPSLEKSFIALGNIFLYREGFDEEQKREALDFFLRCMQFTGPLMAKGVEDTTMYYYNCFIGHNEVGDEPGASGLSVENYHLKMVERQRNRPMTMNATSTHDTKRGEDVRARLNVITEMAEEWKKRVRHWMKVNDRLKVRTGEGFSPDINEEYFIYQTLTGVFPFGGVKDESFLKRLDEYLIKSLREAKTNTEWNAPDTGHENAVISFTRNILKPGSEFLEDFQPFQAKVANFGVINSLTQLMLKATSPGIPDFYQGSELWDFSMVDPDNRRPVNYEERFSLLKMIGNFGDDVSESLFHDLFLTRTDGRIKLLMTIQLLRERRNDQELFLHGKYMPIAVKGRYEDHIISFARVYKNRWFVVIAPLYLSMLPGNADRYEPGSVDWEDTRIILPDTAPGLWSTSLGQKDLKAGNEIMVADVLKVSCPVFLKGKNNVRNRAAGVLAHITSLPGKYGTGDLGPEAYDFADLLQESGQRYWQILPFNPIGKGYAWSPYSSVSAFAGSTIFLSPDLLLRSGLVLSDSLQQIKFREGFRTGFDKAEELRGSLLREAAETFRRKERPYEKKLFADFCEQQKYWLDDFCLFNILKKKYDLPWNKWPVELKNRDEQAIAEATEKYSAHLYVEKFSQYQFQKQWRELKKYCNNNDIRIIGDVSFYVNYDSAEVWANPGIFKLDARKNPLYVAGVPPDFFSETGQLWNMPVYRWDKLRRNGYEWWINRIKRNLELCDVIRFDHFRGFSEYWEVPAGEINAINGKWIPGPGKKIFDLVKKTFPSMPFIAEDLGQIDDKVYRLRDEFGLPGMVVLQFAFGDDTPGSAYIPHNYIRNSIVYTGTHDNNTTKGWYLNELDDKTKKQAEAYVGCDIDDGRCSEAFIRLAYRSVAKLAIIPVQDILGLDQDARLNKPSTSENNWVWKMKKSDLSNEAFSRLRGMAVLFGRI
jgi:malto-oligosyltrehalose synthase/4-alpha-glucanotransferase